MYQVHFAEGNGARFIYWSRQKKPDTFVTQDKSALPLGKLRSRLNLNLLHPSGIALTTDIFFATAGLFLLAQDYLYEQRWRP
jgi:hypothetical protein